MHPTPDSEFGRTPAGVRSWKTTGTPTRLALALAVVLVAVMVAYLAPQWAHNPDLAHGWLTPLAFFFLLHEARKQTPSRFLATNRKTTMLALACLALGALLFCFGSLFMAALEWSHALVAAVFTTSFCALLAAGWICCAQDTQRLVPVNWMAAAALLLWLLSTPLPPGTYAAVTQTLQTFVSQGVLGLLHFVGVAAVRHGNIIQLPNTAVGVEDACSGVRSLLSCLYAGLFFSAVWVKRPASRAFLILLSALLALVMNLLRSLILTLLAYRGVEIAGAWHDFTGYGVVLMTALLLAGIAQRLSSERALSTTGPERPFAVDRPGATPSVLPWILASCFLAILGGALSLCLAVHRSAPAGGPAPKLEAVLPEQHDGWIARPEPGLFRFTAQLQTDTITQTTYYRQTAAGDEEITVYLAYWSPGQAPVSLVASHTPDACWPGAGWADQPVPRRRIALSVGARTLDEAEQRIFTQNEQIQYVWYWHLYDGRVIHPDDVRSPRHLLSLAWEYGFRRTGAQMFVRVSSNQPWEKIAGDPLVQELFSNLKPYGL